MILIKKMQYEGVSLKLNNFVIFKKILNQLTLNITLLFIAVSVIMYVVFGHKCMHE